MYSKIFPSMYDGTLATSGPWEALITFQQLLILADPAGVVDMHPAAIASRTTIPLNIIEAGIRALEQPDPHSRRPDEEGRRIVRLDEHRDWGWRVTNFRYYHKLTSNQDRREKQRDSMRALRAARKGLPVASGDPVNTVLTPVNNGDDVVNALTPVKKCDAVTHVDVDVDVELKPSRATGVARKRVKTRKTTDPGPDFARFWSGGFGRFWSAYPKKKGRKDAIRAWERINPDPATVDAICLAVERAARSMEWQRACGQYVPNPATYLNGERWTDETAIAAPAAAFDPKAVPL